MFAMNSARQVTRRAFTRSFSQKSRVSLMLEGPDMAGLQNRWFNQCIKPLGCDMLQLNGSRVANRAVCMLLVDVDANMLPELEKCTMKEFGKDYQFHSHLSEGLKTKQYDMFNFMVSGPDTPGILGAVATALASNGLNIIDMKSGHDPAPHAGFDIFTCFLTAGVEKGSEANLDNVKSQLEDVASDLGLDISWRDSSKTSMMH